MKRTPFHKTFRRICILLFSFAWMYSHAAPFSPFENTGNITGHVADKDGNALTGASVRLKGTTNSVAANQAGNYQLLNLKPGTYTLVVTYMGFQVTEAQVTVIANQTVTQNFSLEPDKKALQTVIVTAAREGQQRALNQQRIADNIKQVISADLMGRFPDLNVAESLQRLPGVTINRNRGEGSTIQLRGTPANFTNINVNGEQIMGVQEGGDRNAQLDMISVNVLSTMEVVKTLTPDLDGDAVAGVVNMKTPVAASLKARLSADLGMGYNNMRDNISGIGNISYGQRFFANEKNQNGRLGVIVTGSYYRTKNGYDDVNAQAWQSKDFGDGKGAILFPTDFRYVYYDNTRTRKGLSATLDYNFGPNTSIIGNIMYNGLEDESLRYRKRVRMQANSYLVKQADGSYYTPRGRGYNEITTSDETSHNLNMNLQGETTIGKAKLDGGVFYTTSEFESVAANYQFSTGNIALTNSNIYTDDLSATGTDWKNNASLYNFTSIETNNYILKGKNFVGRLNAAIPYMLGNNSSLFKVGVKVKRMHNTRYRPDTYTYATYSGASADGKLTNFLGPTEVSDDFMDGHLVFGAGQDLGKVSSFYNTNKATAFTRDESTIRNSIDSYFYDAVEEVTSAYAMNRIQFNKLMVLGGLRVERTKVTYDGNIIQQDVNGAWVSTTPTRSTNTYTKFLPNLQFKYDLDKTSLIRAALTFGYSRPNFPDLVPGRIVSILNQTVTNGNPDLKPAFATNVDLMYEKYLKNLGIISAGLFYKNIQDFQYNSVTTIQGDEFPGASTYTGWQLYRTLNGDAAKVYGFELNVQNNLTFLPGVLKGLSVYLNYTYANSNADAQLRKDIRLPGQAKHTANGTLSFAYKGFTIQGNVNYNDAFTLALGSNDATDVIRDSRVQVDANTSYKIGKHFTIYLEAVNLTNSARRDYFGKKEMLYEKQLYSFWGRAGVKFRM
ncbi:MAG: TonB-dependent receptor [Chitinophagaceae bacterium]